MVVIIAGISIQDYPVGSNTLYNIPAINTCNERSVNDEE